MDSIKLAVCVSGLCRGNAYHNITLMQQRLPAADFFFSTWEGRESDMERSVPGIPYTTTPEPEMHYNPIDVDPTYFYPPNKINNISQHDRDIRLHQTKQILGHADLVSKLPPEYNVIIRTRYDAFPSLVVNFDPYITQSHEENRAIGFSSYPKNTDIDRLIIEPREYDPHTPRRGHYNNWSSFLMDFLIIHPRKLLDVKQVYELHETKQLHAIEVGWYQVLSQPYGDTHISIRGGVQIDSHTHKWDLNGEYVGVRK